MGQKWSGFSFKCKNKMMQAPRKNYLGIDVSKLWFDVSLMPVVDHAKKPMVSERFDNTVPGMKAFKTWLKPQQVTYDKKSLLVIENTGVYHRLIWSFCSKHNLPLHIGNAAHIKWSLGITRGKNDVIDSQRLCVYCCKQAEELKATAVLDPVFMKLKDLMSSRSRLVAQLHSTKNYIKEIQCTQDKALLLMLDKAHKAAIAGIKKSIIQIEELIAQIIRDNKAIYTNYQLIKTVPGIGHLTAVYIICCTNNFAAKPSGKQLGSYAGVVPFANSSGTSIKGKNEMLVLNAIRNKLLLRVVAVVNKQQPYVNITKIAA